MKRKLTADEAVRLLEEAGVPDRLTQAKFETKLDAAAVSEGVDPSNQFLAEWRKARSVN